MFYKINKVEREMCNYLGWELTIKNPILANFEKLSEIFVCTSHQPQFSLGGKGKQGRGGWSGHPECCGGEVASGGW
jgi:hypothetical protein